MSETVTGLDVMACPVTKLTNARHVELMTVFGDLLDQFGIAESSLKPVCDQFKTLLGKEQASLVATRVNSMVKSIAEADAVRDELHRGLWLTIEAYRHDTDQANKDAANALHLVTSKFGTSIRNKPYVEETALLRQLLAELADESNRQHVDTLAIGHWTAKLAAANQQVSDLSEMRIEEDNNALGYTTRDIRKQVDPLYRKITQGAETFAMLGIAPVDGVGPDFAGFISMLNTTISKLYN